MRKTCAVLLVIVLLCSVLCLAESAWTCPKCGREGLTGNFCGTCGTPRPEEKTWNGFVPGVNCELEENLLKLTEGCDGVSFDVYLQDIHAILESTEAELGYLTYSVYIFGGEFAESAGDEFVEACENSESMACLESSADEETRESILLEKVVEILETEDFPICFLIVEYNEYPLTVTITKNCRVRGQAGMSGELLGELSAGTAVKSKGTVIAADGTGAWYEIEYQGRQAFIAASVVNETEAVKPTAAPTQKVTEAPKPTATQTVKPTATATQTVKPTVTATVTVKPTAQPTATATLVPTATVTPKPSATATQGPTATAVPTATPTSTTTPAPTSTVCNHIYGAWTTTVEAVCGDAGSRSRTCSTCGNVETETIPAPGKHSYFCTKDSQNHWQQCSICGKKAAITAHTFSDWSEFTAPTCTKSGTNTRRCTFVPCGYRENVEGAPATGHTPSNVWVEYSADQHTMYCTVCNQNCAYEPHTFNSEGVCTLCGRINHTHTVGSYKPYGNNAHWLVCAICNKSYSVQPHKFGTGDVCTCCGYSIWDN